MLYIKPAPPAQPQSKEIPPLCTLHYQAVDTPETRQPEFYHRSFAELILCSLYHRWANDRQTSWSPTIKCLVSIFFLTPDFCQVETVFKNGDIFFVKLHPSTGIKTPSAY